MISFDKDKLTTMLKEDNLSENEINIYCDNMLPNENEIFQPFVDAWMTDKHITDLTIEGVKISDVISTKQCHPISAIFYINRLLDQSLTPEQKESVREYLGKPEIRM